MKTKHFLVFAASVWLSAAQLQAQQPNPPKPPGAEERLKHLAEKMEKDLQLNAAQKEKLSAAFKSFFTEMDKLRSMEPPPPPPPADRPAAEKLIKERDSKIKQALTEEQFKIFLEMDKRMRPGGPGKPSKNGPPPPNS